MRSDLHAIVLSIALCAGSASAEEGAPPLATSEAGAPLATTPEAAPSPAPAAGAASTPPASGLELDLAYREARSTRLTGILLFSVGVPSALVLAGASFYLWAAYTFLDIFFDVDGAMAWGAISVLSSLAAVAFLVSGIVLWAVGQGRMRRLADQQPTARVLSRQVRWIATDPFGRRGVRL